MQVRQLEANTAHWRFPVRRWKFLMLTLPSVEASNLLPSVQALFPFRHGREKHGMKNVTTRKRMKASGRSASTSNCMGRSGRKWKWNHVEIRGSERSSLEASAEVPLEASMEDSTGSIRGSFQSHRRWRLSTTSIEASIAST